MTSHIAAAAFAAACVLLPGQACAQATTPAEKVSLQQWSQRVEKALDQQIRYPTLMGGQPFATGLVRVKFNCSENGSPDKVSLAKSSGSGALDRAAIRAVKRIVTLHPLPDGMKHDQQYQAVLLFENDPVRHERAMKTVRDDAVKSNGWFKSRQVAGVGVGLVEVAAR